MEINNFTAHDIKRAIEHIDVNPSVRNGRASSTYDLIFEGKAYPPILVLSIANQLKGGSEITLNDFGNSIDKPFTVLKKLEFIVMKKNGFYSQLIQFLEQSKTNDLKYGHYIKTYNGLNVRVSFGKGNVARIPWISFLGNDQKTENGIYPVYLLYKSVGKLILAYGVSETNKPHLSWNITETDYEAPLKIKEYFNLESLGQPERYGESFVYKVYDVDNLPDEITIDNELSELTDYYKFILSHQMQTESLSINKEKYVDNYKFNIDLFISNLESSFLSFKRQLIIRFCSSVLTKPFIVLTGLSGSGKTKIAQAFSRWICKDKDQYCIVPVGADWTNREPLLGYPNALNNVEYIKPDNGVLDLLIHAKKYDKLPHFLILDEMNLSHVERYFADFLSVMESDEEISLYAGQDRKASDGTEIPKTIGLPPNLFIIGTVNIDETTYMFSPKVLDRANVIEFRVSSNEILSFLENPKTIDLSELTTRGAGMARSFLELAANWDFEKQEQTTINQTLVGFFNELKKLGAEFGYRSAHEIVRLINQLGVIDQEMDLNTKIDIAIMQKLLPKLHGSRRKLCPVLLKLGEFCLKEPIEKIETEVFGKDDFDLKQDIVKYPITLEKLIRMYKGAIENGFASYAEA